MSRAALALVVSLGVIVLLLVLAALGAVTFFAYDEQSSRVDEAAARVAELEDAYARQSARVAELESAEEQILDDHAAIGQAFAETREELQEATRAARAASNVRLPAKLIPLAAFVRRGFLVPRGLPTPLRNARVTIGRYRDGYSLTWPGGLSLFAASSRGEPLRVLTRQSSEKRRTIEVRGREIVVIPGASTVFAWRAGNRTYTVLASPNLRRLAPRLIAAMR